MFKISYLYDIRYKTMQEVNSHENVNIRTTGQGDARHRQKGSHLVAVSHMIDQLSTWWL
jgi:hypothetical protein